MGAKWRDDDDQASKPSNRASNRVSAAVEAEHHFLLAYGLHNIKLPLNKPDNAFQSIKMIIDI